MRQKQIHYTKEYYTYKSINITVSIAGAWDYFGPRYICEDYVIFLVSIYKTSQTVYQDENSAPSE